MSLIKSGSILNYPVKPFILHRARNKISGIPGRAGKITNTKLLYIVAVLSVYVLIFHAGCATPQINEKTADAMSEKRHFPVYLVSKGIHTGLVIPVNTVSENKVEAISFFNGEEYVDFGWGDEAYYQKPGAGFCLGVKAVLLPTSSVMRVEGISGILEDKIQWSSFAFKFNMTEVEFTRLCEYIDMSFRRDEKNGISETGRKSRGGVIYFKSVHYYHMFNTCNTWAARGLEHAGMVVSPFMVITAEDLYNEAVSDGVVLKKR